MRWMSAWGSVMGSLALGLEMVGPKARLSLRAPATSISEPLITPSRRLIERMPLVETMLP